MKNLVYLIVAGLVFAALPGISKTWPGLMPYKTFPDIENNSRALSGKKVVLDLEVKGIIVVNGILRVADPAGNVRVFTVGRRDRNKLGKLEKVRSIRVELSRIRAGRGDVTCNLRITSPVRIDLPDIAWKS